MRRSAVLAFGLFALAASLPAEVRECLPRFAACEHGTRAAGASCSRSARPAGLESSCSRRAAAGCPESRRTPAPDSCRLHPTPDAAPSRDRLSVPAPDVAEPFEPILEIAVADASRDGWVETPVPRPRGPARDAPHAPRPPPLAV
jgi:hypothetical protein